MVEQKILECFCRYHYTSHPGCKVACKLAFPDTADMRKKFRPFVQYLKQACPYNQNPKFITREGVKNGTAKS